MSSNLKSRQSHYCYNEEETDGLIKMAALGRRFQLGTLYDYRTDTIIIPERGNRTSPQKGLQQTSEANNESSTNENNLSMKVDKLSFDEGSSSCWSHMKLSPHLEASVAAGLIDKYRGASKYALEEPNVSQALRTIRVRIRAEKKVWVGEPPEPCDGKATHFVEAITYGAETFILFQRSLADGDFKEDIEEQMDEALEELIDALLLDQDETVDEPRLSNAWRGRYYGDLCARPRDCSLPDAYKLVRKLHHTVETKPTAAIPLTVWLRPLDNSAHFRDLEDNLLTGCKQAREGLIRVKAMAQTFLNEDDKLKTFPQLRQSLRQFIDYLGRYVQLFQSELGRHVPAVRSGDENHQPIATLLDTVAALDCFQPAKLDGWLNGKKTEVRACWKFLSSLAEEKDLPLIKSKEELDDILLTIRPHWTVALVLPKMDGKSDHRLLSMNQYVTNNRRIIRIPDDSSEAVEDEAPWFAADDNRQELMTIAHRLLQQAEQKQSGVAFLMTWLLPSPTPYRPTLALFKEGRLLTDDFHLPLPPTNLRTRLNIPVRPLGITLEWDYEYDHLKDVLHFIVQHKSKHQEADWESSNTPTPVTFIELKSGSNTSGDLQFRVAAVTRIGQGEFSSILETHQATPKIYPAPESLKASLVTHDAIELSWTPPQCPPGMAIKFYQLHHDHKVTQVSDTRFRLDGLQMATRYTVEVAAHYGADGLSPGQSITVTTLDKPLRVADTIRNKSLPLGKESGLEIYTLPLTNQRTADPSKIRRCVFGQARGGVAHQHKTVLVMGATGSGKSTLINGLVNYILGVEWEDHFRFKLVHETMSISQAHSQTSAVTAYDIHHMDGMRIPYSLTIVDTPGYGDTKGLVRDQAITANLKNFFQDQGGIQEVDAIGFVSQASLPRLTPTQHYIFDSVLSIFGNDIKDNIQLLLTFADGQVPPVLAAIREAKIPCPVDSRGQPEHHKFNSSALFAPNNSADGFTGFNQMFWKMVMKNFQNFFARLNAMKTQSLSLTRQVLDERKQLGVTVERLQLMIGQGLVKVDELSKRFQVIANPKVLDLVETVSKCIQRLEDIALLPNPLSTPEYIDVVIKAEEQDKKPGFKERVASLKYEQSLAELTLTLTEILRR